MARNEPEPRVVTLRDVYDDLQTTKRDLWKVKTAVIVIAVGIGGQYIGLSQSAAEAFPFK